MQMGITWTASWRPLRGAIHLHPSRIPPPPSYIAGSSLSTHRAPHRLPSSSLRVLPRLRVPRPVFSRDGVIEPSAKPSPTWAHHAIASPCYHTRASKLPQCTSPHNCYRCESSARRAPSPSLALRADLAAAVCQRARANESAPTPTPNPRRRRRHGESDAITHHRQQRGAHTRATYC